MSVFLWVVQLVVSLIAVFGGVGLIVYWAFKEDWKLGAACLVFPPFLLYYIPTRWGQCRIPLVVFVACFVVAALLQRARLGYWAWPDVGS